MTLRVRLPSLLLAIAMLLAAGLPAHAQPGADEFHARVVALYGFHPYTLTKAQVGAKSVELDAFWSQAKANPSGVLPLLRGELANPSAPDFFSYDGSKLLLSLSTDRADRELALASLPRVDLRDIDDTDYLKTVQWFASKGFDTRAAAFRILADPDFKAFIPEHVLTLGQDYALIYMLFPMAQSIFQQDLVHRLESEPDPRNQKSLALAVWYLATPDGATALKSFGARPGLDPSTADYVRELLARSSGLSVSFSSADTLRVERMRMMQRPISDEALIEFDSLTRKLLSKL